MQEELVILLQEELVILLQEELVILPCIRGVESILAQVATWSSRRKTEGKENFWFPLLK